MTNRIYGYCRVSTMKQSLKRQKEDISKIYPDAIFFEESYTGATLDRPEWTKLMRTVKKGDTIVFTEISRLARCAEEGFKVYRELYDRGVNLVFMKENPLNTDNFRNALSRAAALSIETKTGRDVIDNYCNGQIELLKDLLFGLAEEQIKNAFAMAEHELECNHDRTASGMRSKGACNTLDSEGNVIEYGSIAKSKIGKKLTTKKSVEQKKAIAKYSRDFNGTLNDIEVMKMTGLARNTYYKYKAEMKNEM